MHSFLENRPAVSRAETTILKAGTDEGGFKPLFTAGQPPAAEMGLDGAAGKPGCEHEAEAGSRVELVQKNGRVEKIIVTCGCGNRIELNCGYQA